MALEICKECGHSVSSTSPRCPNCGHAMVNQRPLGDTVINFIGAAILLAVIVVYGSNAWIAMFQ